MDSGDKGTNKAMSTAYKTMAFMAFCIPTEGDNDTENQTHEVKPQQAAKTGKPTHKVSKAQSDLLNELGQMFTGDRDQMADALRNYSSFQGTDGERYLKLADLEKANDNEKFQRWVGSALGKLRKDGGAA